MIADKSVVGVTTNPSIFQAAIAGSDLYATDVATLSGEGSDAVVRALTTDDVRAACDLLAPVAPRSGGIDGRVSIEVDPRLAHDTDATIAQAHQLWLEVGRPNLLIKIPATKEGLPAIRAAIADGISVNVTLIFSLERYGRDGGIHRGARGQARSSRPARRHRLGRELLRQPRCSRWPTMVRSVATPCAVRTPMPRR